MILIYIYGHIYMAILKPIRTKIWARNFVGTYGQQTAILSVIHGYVKQTLTSTFFNLNGWALHVGVF